jgi:hypothetical protein
MLGLGPLLLIGFVALLNAGSRGSGGGIMSKQMAFGILLLLGTLGLLSLWTSALIVGLLGTLVARRCSPLMAALVMFLCISLAPAVSAGLYAYEHAKREQELRHLKRWGR